MTPILLARVMSLGAVAIPWIGIAPPPDDLDAFMKAQMTQREVNGLSLAIIQDGKIDARAYGVTSRGGAPVTTATLFQAGSISKPVAAMGALRLVEQGALSLREDVNAKLKSWKVPENEFTRTEKVSLRALLGHAAGLTVHGFPGYDVTERMPSTVEVLDGKGNTEAVRVNAVPWSLTRYSGGGYTVMQLLVEDVTGKPFHEYMREAVLAPLGMTSSTYQQPVPADRAALAASGHYADRSAVSGKWHVYPEMAAAGLWTTATDLAKFAMETQQSLLGKSNKVLSRFDQTCERSPSVAHEIGRRGHSGLRAGRRGGAQPSAAYRRRAGEPLRTACASTGRRPRPHVPLIAGRDRPPDRTARRHGREGAVLSSGSGTAFPLRSRDGADRRARTVADARYGLHLMEEAAMAESPWLFSFGRSIGIALAAVGLIVIRAVSPGEAYQQGQAPRPLGKVDVLSGPVQCTGGDCYEIRVTCPEVAAPARARLKVGVSGKSPRGTILFTTGALGTHPYESTAESSRLLSELSTAGFRTVQLQWIDSWLLGSAGNEEGHARLACRPATVARWVHDTLHQPGASSAFCATGHSGGAAQVAYMLSHYGLEDILASVVPTGGPPMARMDRSCARADAKNDEKNPGLTFPDWATRIIDAGFGFFPPGGPQSFAPNEVPPAAGPCARDEPSFREKLRQASVASGEGDYVHPRTMVWFVFEGIDDSHAVAMGTIYHDLLRERGSPLVQKTVVPDVGHSGPKGLYNSRSGVDRIRDILLEGCRPRTP